MKKMKSKVFAVLLTFILIVVNVMPAIATEGTGYEFCVYEYGDDCVFKYWTNHYDESEQEVWEELNVGGFVTSLTAGTTIGKQIENSLQIREEPIREGANFEGWARFKVEGDTYTFMSQSDSKPYFTTEEMLNSVMPEYNVQFVPKWSDINIEEYFVVMEGDEYQFEVYEYGTNCVFKYWTSYYDENGQEVWEELDYGGFSTHLYVGYQIGKQVKDSLRIKEDPTREGSTFEGWARFKQEGNERIFMPKSTTDPYFTTEELFDSIMPEYNVTFAPKWSDMDIEDYYPEYFMTALDANGGKVSWSYSGIGDGDEVRVDEFESKIEVFSQTARQSLGDLLKESEGEITGINKPGEILKDWTLYQAETMEHVFCAEGETVPKSTENQMVILFDTITWEDGTKEYVYLIIDGYKLIANNVSTEKILNEYKGAHYYAVANWEKSVGLVENQKVTESLVSEGKDLVAKIKDLKEDDTSLEAVVSKQTIAQVQEALRQEKEIKTELVVYPVQEKLVDEKEKSSIVTEVTKELGKDAKIQYLDIQVMLKADEHKLGNILKLENKIEITIAIPDDMKAENGKYVVLRNHNGKVDVLDTKLNADSTVTFETDRFSTYALAYVPTTSQAAPATPAPTPEVTNPAPEATTPAVEESKPAVKEPTSVPATQTVPASPKTNDASSIVGYSVLCMMVLAVVLWKRKELFAK